MPHVWALIRAIDFFNRTKDKRDMDLRTVVSIITGDYPDSDWNGSDEEGEDSRVEDSVMLDRLSLEQGKMADTRGSVALLDFVI